MTVDREQVRRDAERAVKYGTLNTRFAQPLLDALAELEQAESLTQQIRNRAERAEARAEQAERDLEGVHLALAEADVPRADGNDEPLYSEQHRVRLLRERVEQAERERDEKKRELAVAYGNGRTDDEAEWFSELDRQRARAEAAEARLAKVPALAAWESETP